MYLLTSAFKKPHITGHLQLGMKLELKFACCSILFSYIRHFIFISVLPLLHPSNSFTAHWRSQQYTHRNTNTHTNTELIHTLTDDAIRIVDSARLLTGLHFFIHILLFVFYVFYIFYFFDFCTVFRIRAHFFASVCTNKK